MEQSTHMMHIAKQLFDAGIVQFGNFTLKSGIQSPIYLDMRRLIAYPSLLRIIVHELSQKSMDFSFDLLCGVPYGALPLAIGVCLERSLPMIMPRKEVKHHGTKKHIEGIFKAGQKALIIEDLVTSGASTLETLEKLNQADLHVDDVLVVIDRQQGATKRIAQKGVMVHALYTLSDITDALFAQGVLDDTTITNVQTFIQSNQFS